MTAEYTDRTPTDQLDSDDDSVVHGQTDRQGGTERERQTDEDTQRIDGHSIVKYLALNTSPICRVTRAVASASRAAYGRRNDAAVQAARDNSAALTTRLHRDALTTTCTRRHGHRLTHPASGDVTSTVCTLSILLNPK